MRKIDALIGSRTTRRLLSDEQASARLIEEARGIGVSMTLVGSLARGEFRGHSDVDFVVRGGDLSASRLAAVEKLAAECLRETGLPYDLVFEADVGTERVEEMIDDVLTSRLR